MKKLLLLFSLLFLTVGVGHTNPGVPTMESSRMYSIDNGWYEASVLYFNPSTYTRNTYTLDVKVEYNRVVEISFGNGGSVHAGYNNSGYLYTGGTLSFQRNYSTGEIISATTRVSITEGMTTRTFDISL